MRLEEKHSTQVELPNRDRMEDAREKLKLQADTTVAMSEQHTQLLIQASKERTAYIELMTQKGTDIQSIKADLGSWPAAI